MDDLIVALKWQGSMQIVLTNEFDLKLFEKLMGFTVINLCRVPKDADCWTFAMPKGGLSWWKWQKAELSGGVDQTVFNYVASGDIAALPHLNYNELYLLKNGEPKKEDFNGVKIGSYTFK